MKHTKKNTLSREEVKEKLKERKKFSKMRLKEKRARLVIKNLPFKATETNMKEYFEQYGEVSNVELLKKSDGKLVGCGFVQFKLVQKAAKAKHHTNGKQFLGRQILVDFAKPKDKYQKNNKGENVKHNKIKEMDVKEESHVDNEEFGEKICTVNVESDEEGKEVDENNISKKNSYVSHDVIEEKTIFIKNVPFHATNADLKECMLRYGPIYYALICVDKLTEHSKGTAFVKFVNKEDASKALQAGTELTLLGNVLDCHPAIDRDEVKKQNQDKNDAKTSPKDSRNLYLVKEGVILAGTKAAESVSASDMAKRLKIEQYKTQMLRNLNMFVSKNRLVVHNLPASWDDKKFRTLLLKYGGPNAVIKEARIMRDMKNLDADGLGKSKEYGFVSFTRHENALAALRDLNNNPDIFSTHKRPIITYSIENRMMVNAKLKRQEKSKVNNPTYGGFKPHSGSTRKKLIKTTRKKIGKGAKAEDNFLNDVKEFTGVTAKQGVRQKMRSKYQLVTQGKIHYDNLKKEKIKKRHAKKTLSIKKQEFTKQEKQKINKNKNSDNFSKLVNEYKKTLITASTSSPTKSKWYE